MQYSIGEFSRLTNLGIHTLRYYEKEGLLLPSRNASNRRRYSEQDFVWVEFIKRLKETGMPIREIKRYAKLRAAGNATLFERMEMLTVHRTALNQQIQQLQTHMQKLDDKIALYHQKIEEISPE